MYLVSPVLPDIHIFTESKQSWVNLSDESTVVPKYYRRALEHLHPGMEEAYEILEGQAAFRIAGRELVAGVGERVVVPPGTAHLAWNPTQSRVRLRITMRPALRWAEFTERLFAAESPAGLLSDFAPGIQLVTPGAAES